MAEFKEYHYDGPVMIFSTLIERNWHAETMARSIAEAKRNFIFRAKKEFNYSQNAAITLPGTIKRSDVNG